MPKRSLLRSRNVFEVRFMAEHVDFEDSSALKRGSYDVKTRILTICFQTDKTYRYFDVPNEYWSELCSASSKGWFFTKHIQNKFQFEEAKAAYETERAKPIRVPEMPAATGKSDDPLENLRRLLLNSKPRKVVHSMDEIFDEARSGDPISQISLGLAYMVGQGLPRDFLKAGDWFAKAAIQGDTRGQLFYAMHLHASGRQHWPAAYKWFLLASLGGKGREQLDKLEKILLPAEIELGRAQAIAFVPVSLRR